MTTIAYDGRLVAIDSQVTAGSVKFTEKKWYEGSTPDGDHFILFGSGNVCDIQECSRLLQEYGLETAKDYEGDFGAFIVGLRSNPVVLEAEGGVIEVRRTAYANGSGQAAALAGLVDGKSATDAVLLASKVDLYTGGPVHTYDTRAHRWLKPRG